MKKNLIKSIRTLFLLTLLFSLLSFFSCGDSEGDDSMIDDPNETETVDLTSLPFGGSSILRKDQGNQQPDFESLWLCGVPPDGAGNSDASDWTNADGTWDYSRKPIVEGSVSWISDFAIALDGTGKRIITGNSLPDHPTGVFPIDPNSLAYQYDRNMNPITARDIMFEFPAVPEVADNEGCVTYGPAGISLSGSVIYHGASTLGNDCRS
jgi:hypothetical protein